MFLRGVQPGAVVGALVGVDPDLEGLEFTLHQLQLHFLVLEAALVRIQNLLDKIIFQDKKLDFTGQGVVDFKVLFFEAKEDEEEVLDKAAGQIN